MASSSLYDRVRSVAARLREPKTINQRVELAVELDAIAQEIGEREERDDEAIGSKED